MTTLEAEQLLLRQWRSLPPEKQIEALGYMAALHEKVGHSPRVTSRGMWEDLPISLTEDDIDEVRREMWADFPRDISA